MPAAPCPGRARPDASCAVAGSATRKPAVESPPYPAQRRRTWRYDTDRTRNGGPLSQGAASPFGGPDKPTSGPFDGRLGRGREDRLRRTDRRPRAGAGSKDPPLSERPGLQRPAGPSSTAPGFSRNPGRPAPLKLPRELRRPGSDRRSRAGRERRSSPKGMEARRPAGPPNRRREPGQGRNPPPPPDRDPREGIAAPEALLRVGEPAGPKPDGPTALAVPAPG